MCSFEKESCQGQIPKGNGPRDLQDGEWLYFHDTPAMTSAVGALVL